VAKPDEPYQTTRQMTSTWRGRIVFARPPSLRQRLVEYLVPVLWALLSSQRLLLFFGEAGRRASRRAWLVTFYIRYPGSDKRRLGTLPKGGGEPDMSRNRAYAHQKAATAYRNHSKPTYPNMRAVALSPRRFKPGGAIFAVLSLFAFATWFLIMWSL
jgi:hypothetical protein